MAEGVRLDGSSGGHTMDKSITLPPDEIFRNLANAKRFAIDIGGSLTKLAYYSTVQHKVAKVRSFDHATKEASSDKLYEISVQEEKPKISKPQVEEHTSLRSSLRGNLDSNDSARHLPVPSGQHWLWSVNCQEFSKEDMSKSLLHMISNDIGQLACLYAKLHNLSRVYFGGFFIRGHPVTMHTITYSINFFTKGEVQALFLRHEGYLGAIGAFLKGAEKDNPNQYSWGENYAGSSGLMSVSPDMNPMQRARSGTFDMLEMDRLERQLVNLPLLLDPSSYVPDTVDLTEDASAREYWLYCFEEALDGVVKRAVASQPDTQEAAERAEKFSQKYRHKLQTLRHQPFAYGSLTVRSLLDTREHCLNEFNFPDPYSKIKQKENDGALKYYLKAVKALEQLDWKERQFALVRGLLAGNVFDWGAKAVSDVLESDPEFGFEEAKQQLEERPWLVDTFEQWLERLKGPPHKCALFFVDNSGVDIILGVMPFVRELLFRGTEVVLASNSGPALNDVTNGELQILTERLAAMDPVIETGLRDERLTLVQSGSSSPCLDLSRLDKELAMVVRERQTDLVIIEGMGRAIHTNYYAMFSCESLKMAVIKNAWLADRLGGKLFSVVFKYEVPSEKPSQPSAALTRS
ncbi:4'-phosphopantetheine phosphatase isoform X3 [Takifugu flavidus]|uniref:4'-phosphopantetheine phosphatase isoform X3 n=1 Tax=Takifugu flavidus TaxID=433684 RepID=UPI002544A511|nr:4'-phosphopantetheine phosphatase isoform X3 [Takifugu flavidus]